MNSTYTIQTIPHNLSKGETIVQIVEVLDHLNAVTQDIFSRVSKRLESNTEKLSNISNRIDAASSKLEHLKGDKKAKTVFSSSKYPAIDVNRDYVSIFKEPTNIERVKHEVKYSKYVSTYEPLSKLQFYHVKVTDEKDACVLDGLGEVPEDIHCINNVLLFNTGRNVYRDFKSSQSLKGPDVTSNKEHFTTSELGAAPLSISQRSSMQQGTKDNYFYTPKIEELPALDVPWDLPDLPGIADDIRYENEAAPSIAPSIVNNSLIVDLDLPNISEIKTELDISHLPPPPPPPLQDIPEPPAVHQLPITNSTMIQPSESSVTNTKSLEMSDTTDDSNPKTDQQEEPSAPPPPPPVASLPHIDSRASLMDAIRKAGGSQRANLRKTSEVSKNCSSKNPSGGDLMADLHSKLMMRRKGISGAKKTEQNSVSPVTADSALARLSSIIPPPTKGSDVGSGVSTDEDAWNDDDI